MYDLKTSHDVIKAAGVLRLEHYFDVVPLTDTPGFSVKRDYPPHTRLSKVLNARGGPDLCCLIHFVVEPSDAQGGVRGMHFSVGKWSRWRQKKLEGYDFSDPDCPTPESVHTLKRSPKPLDLSFDGEFFYDTADGCFYGKTGPATGQQILDYLYDYHCRTLSFIFLIKWGLRTAIEKAVRYSLRKMQMAFLWILEHGYDIKPTTPKPERRFMFRRYTLKDFERAQGKGSSHFFGFQSSNRSLSSNMIIVALACVLAYWLLPPSRFFQAIYRSAPLTTVTLIFIFLLADQLVPLLLKGAVCLISQFSPATLFIVRKVKA